MITINMNFSTPQEAAAALERLYNLPLGSITNPGPMAIAAADAMVVIHQAKAKTEEPKAPKQQKAEKPAATPTASETASAATTGPAAAEPASESPSELDYSVVQATITQRVKTDRDHVVATLAKFGVKKGTELQPAQYADFLKELG